MVIWDRFPSRSHLKRSKNKLNVYYVRAQMVFSFTKEEFEHKRYVFAINNS